MAAGPMKKHQQSCFYPKTLDRLYEIFEVTRLGNGCHVATVKLNDSGYPRFKGAPLEGMRASRMVVELVTNVPVPSGLKVMHSCDNPPCVNPDHLSVGTQAQNLADMRAKNRHSDPPINTGWSQSRRNKYEATIVTRS